MHIIQYIAARGFTAIYGPPGSGKTSAAAKLGDRVANRVLWISTNETPASLKGTFLRVGVSAGKFHIFNFPPFVPGQHRQVYSWSHA